MNYWVLKSEPTTYSFDDLMRDKRTVWDGVRNYQARNNLRAMEVGDLAIIYHSGGEKAAVGISKIVKAAYKDPKSDEDWSAIDLAPVKPLIKAVTLAQMKADKMLKNITLVKHSRLSVSPITKSDFERVLYFGS